MYKHITGIILSGGKSTRMGENKAFLKIKDVPVIERLSNILKSLFERVIIITNEPKEYQFLNLEVFTDIFKNIGPIAGIHSGLIQSQTEKNFIISCDKPFINAEMIESIVNYSQDEKIVVPESEGFIHYLCGLYPKSALNIIEEMIKNEISNETLNSSQKKRKINVSMLINSYPSIIIKDTANLKGYFPKIFFNMNNFAEYQYAVNFKK